MPPLTIDIHQLATDSARGEAARLGFELRWAAHAIGDDWTVWMDTALDAPREPGAYEVVTADDWRAFEAAVGKVLRAALAPTG